MFKRLAKGLFGDIKNGRLKPLAFLLYSLLIVVLIVILITTIVFSVGVSAQLMGGDVDEAIKKLGAWFDSSTIIMNGLVSAVFIFAQLNIAAKRIRDIGLPGWWVVLSIGLLTLIFSNAVSTETASGLNAAAWLALFMVPSGVLESRTSPPQDTSQKVTPTQNEPSEKSDHSDL